MARGIKTGGRKAGTPNKVKKDLRTMIDKFLVDNFDEFKKSWEMVEKPEVKADLYIKASKFVIPALQSVSMDVKTDKDKNIEEQLLELSEKP